jgi:hypothetical protein
MFSEIKINFLTRHYIINKFFDRLKGSDELDLKWG